MKKWLAFVLAAMMLCYCAMAQAESEIVPMKTDASDSEFTPEPWMPSEKTPAPPAMSTTPPMEYMTPEPTFPSDGLPTPTVTSVIPPMVTFTPEPWIPGDSTQTSPPMNIATETDINAGGQTLAPVSMPEICVVRGNVPSLPYEVNYTLPASLSVREVTGISFENDGDWYPISLMRYMEYPVENGFQIHFGVTPSVEYGVSTARIFCRTTDDNDIEINVPIRIYTPENVPISGEVTLKPTMVVSTFSSIAKIKYDSNLNIRTVHSVSQCGGGLNIDLYGTPYLVNNGEQSCITVDFYSNDNGSTELQFVAETTDNQFIHVNAPISIVPVEQIVPTSTVTVPVQTVPLTQDEMVFANVTIETRDAIYRWFSGRILDGGEWYSSNSVSVGLLSGNWNADTGLYENEFEFNVYGASLGKATISAIVLTWFGDYVELQIPLNVQPIESFPVSSKVVLDEVSIYGFSSNNMTIRLPGVKMVMAMMVNGDVDHQIVTSSYLQNWYHDGQNVEAYVQIGAGRKAGKVSVDFLCLTDNGDYVLFEQPVEILSPSGMPTAETIVLDDRYWPTNQQSAYIDGNAQMTYPTMLYSSMYSYVETPANGWTTLDGSGISVWLENVGNGQYSFHYSGPTVGKGLSYIVMIVRREDDQYIRVKIPVHVVDASEVPVSREIELDPMTVIISKNETNVEIAIPENVELRNYQQVRMYVSAPGDWTLRDEGWAYYSDGRLRWGSFRAGGMGTSTVNFLCMTPDGNYIRLKLPVQLQLPGGLGFPDYFAAENVHTTVGARTSFAAPVAVGGDGQTFEWYITGLNRDQVVSDAVTIPEDYGMETWWDVNYETPVTDAIFNQPGIYEMLYHIDVEGLAEYVTPVNVYVEDAQGNVPGGPIIVDAFGAFFGDESPIMETTISFISGCPYVVSEEEIVIFEFSIFNMGALKRITGKSPVWTVEQLSGEDIGLRVNWEEARNLFEDGSTYETAMAHISYNKTPTKAGQIRFRINCTWNGETVSKEYLLNVEEHAISAINGLVTEMTVQAGKSAMLRFPEVLDQNGNQIDRWWNLQCMGPINSSSLSSGIRFTVLEPGEYQAMLITWLENDRLEIPITIKATDENGNVPTVARKLIIDPYFWAEGDEHSILFGSEKQCVGEFEIADPGVKDASFTISITGSKGLAKYSYELSPSWDEYHYLRIIGDLVQEGDETVTVTVTSSSGLTATDEFEAHYRKAAITGIRFNGASFNAYTGQPILLDLTPYLQGDLNADYTLSTVPRSADGNMEINAIAPPLYVAVPIWTLEGSVTTRIDDMEVSQVIDGQRYHGYITSDEVTFVWSDKGGMSGSDNANGSTINWSMDDQGKMTITGNGAMSDSGNGATWKKHMDDITALELRGITSIPDEAFADCTVLMSVSLPDILTEIGAGSFKGCTSLENIDIPDSVTRIGASAFEDCTLLNSIDIPEQVASIEADTFNGCAAMATISLPENLADIGAKAFARCVALTDVTFAGSQEQAALIPIAEGNEYLVQAHWHYKMDNEGNLENAVYWALAGDGTLTISGTGRMPEYSSDYAVPWYGRIDQITRVVVENGVQNIGAYLFNGCKNVTTVSLPASITSIGSNAFSYCENLTVITIPDSVKRIDGNAFAFCGKLERVVLPAKNLTLGSSVFYGCKALKQIALPAGMTFIPYELLSETGITELVIPDGVTEISYNAFWNCGSLTKVTLPASVNMIRNNAFGSTAVTDVYFGGAMDDILSIMIAGNNDPLLKASWHCKDKTGAYPVMNSGCLMTGLEWRLTDNGTLTISGSGVIPNYEGEFLAPWHELREHVTSIVLTEGVRSIGRRAFDEMNRVTTVSLPDSLMLIDVQAFSNCSALTQVDIPANVRQISDWAFSNCNALTTVTLPASLRSIGEFAFESCGSLTEINLPGGLTNLPYGMFRDSGLTTIVIPEGVDSVHAAAFADNRAMTSVTLPASIHTIYSSAFNNTALTDVYFCGAKADIAYITISDGNVPLTNAVWHCNDGDTTYTAPVSGYLTAGITWRVENDQVLTISGQGSMPDDLRPWAIWRDSITSIVVGEGINSIGRNAFAGMNAVTAVSLPSSLTSINQYAFSDCGQLAAITIPAGVTQIGHSAFANCRSMNSIILPDTVYELGENAFAECAALQQIQLPKSINCIPRGLFCGAGLTSITVPAHVDTIGYGAFGRCGELTEVSLPAALNTIGSDLFEGCDKLTDIYYPGTTDDVLKIVIGVNNSKLINAVWHYADGIGSYPTLSSGILSPDFDWRLDFNGTLIVSGGGAMPDCNSELPAPWNKYAPYIRSVIVENGVKTIGSEAFADFTKLTKVAIPNTVTSIGNGAFRGDTALEQIEIPSSVTRIGEEAFRDTGLTTITLPDSIISIGAYAFSYCKNLTEIGLSAKLVTIPDSLFRYSTALTEVVIPDHVKQIDWEAFYYCRNLERVSLPRAIGMIGDAAFGFCDALTDVTFRGKKAEADGVFIGNGNEALIRADWHYTDSDSPSQVVTSGHLSANVMWSVDDGTLTISGTGVMPDFASSMSAPWTCLTTGIRSIRVEAGIRSIGQNAFYGLNQVTSVTLPESVTSIGDNAFCNLKSLSGIVLPSHLTEIGYAAFCNTGLETISIPDTATVIGVEAFARCDQLTGVQLPGGLTSLSESLFLDCDKLAAVEIPDNVTSIGWDAFYSCSALTEITLPESLVSVDGSAFGQCPLLTKVIYRGVKVNAATISFGSNNSNMTNALWQCEDYSGPYPAATAGWLTQYISWSLDNGILTISGRGAMPGFDWEHSTPWTTQAANITGVVIEAGVKSIGSGSFSNLDALTTVSIADSVTSIGDEAFINAHALKQIALPQRLTSIRDRAFENSGLESLVLPSSVKEIGANAFWNCYRLESITLPAGMTAIPEEMCAYNYALKEIVIPEGVTSIGECAFINCTGLKKVSLPASMVQIEENAFGNCTALTNVRYNGTMDDAFYLLIAAGNSCLTDAAWKYRFDDPTTNLTAVLTLPAALTTIQSEAFCGTAANAVVIPSGVKCIESRAFADSAKLMYVNIPESVTSIASDAFAGSEHVTVICLEGGNVERWTTQNGLDCMTY